MDGWAGGWMDVAVHTKHGSYACTCYVTNVVSLNVLAYVMCVTVDWMCELARKDNRCNAEGPRAQA